MLPRTWTSSSFQSTDLPTGLPINKRISNLWLDLSPDRKGKTAAILIRGVEQPRCVGNGVQAYLRTLIVIDLHVHHWTTTTPSLNSTFTNRMDCTIPVPNVCMPARLRWPSYIILWLNWRVNKMSTWLSPLWAQKLLILRWSLITTSSQSIVLVWWYSLCFYDALLSFWSSKTSGCKKSPLMSFWSSQHSVPVLYLSLSNRLQNHGTMLITQLACIASFPTLIQHNCWCFL